MATIPNERSLGERVVARRRVPIVDNASGAIEAQALGAAAEKVGMVVERFAVGRAAQEAAEASSTLRTTWATKLLERQNEAADDGAGFTGRVLSEFDADVETATQGRSARGAQHIRQFGQQMRTELAAKAAGFEVESQVQSRVRSFEESTERARIAASLDPDSAVKTIMEQTAAIQDSALPPSVRSDLLKATRSIGASAAIGLAKRDPAATLAALAKEKSGSAVIDTLTPEARHGVEQLARAQLVEQSTAGVMNEFETSVDAGTKALASLAKSGIAPDLLEDIRANVGQRVSQLRAQRRQEHVQDLVRIDREIATDTTSPGTEQLVHGLYSNGTFSPDEYSNALARIDDSVLRRAKSGAATASIAEALAAGLPLDPRDADHRKALDSYFVNGTRGLTKGAPDWASAAIAVANKTRMLPDSVLAWTRQALRSPDDALAANAAQFFGAVRAGVPDAVSGFDEDSRAFAGTVNAMIEAGTSPKKAVETARANVFELKPEIREQRRTQYKHLVKNSPGALSGLIDRDFDPGMFSGQPAASLALQTDFDSQAERYFEKVGDINLARDLAWSDITRVYGPTSVNGDPMMVAFPPERFGVKPEEVRTEIGDFLKANPQADGSTADEITLVPDSLTLRQAGNAMSGEYVRPSYKLVTKNGDLVLDSHGVPKRWTIPTGEELTKRMRAAQAVAEARAQEQVDKARKQRESLRKLRENPVPYEGSY